MHGDEGGIGKRAGGEKGVSGLKQQTNCKPGPTYKQAASLYTGQPVCNPVGLFLINVSKLSCL